MRFTLTFLLLFLFLLQPFTVVFADEQTEHMTENDQRLALYQKVEAITQVPWYFLAAVDTYERNLRRVRHDREKTNQLISIYFSKKDWAGPLNPNEDDDQPLSLSLFGGIGKDGNGNGRASLTEDEDILYTFATYLEQFGFREEDFKRALSEKYQREQTVNIIYGHALIYRHFNTLHLEDTAFPLPLHVNYSYRSTWGDNRGWGGRRIHEGTDLFTHYYVPVRATTYGLVEVKGWNEYGGWRVGIRDLNNVYHYYAHLSGFEKGIEIGKIVSPGETIGYTGSSGYGPPGTIGKFPPHLHYGMYQDNGKIEWSFDPYPSLKAWERKERNKKNG